MSFVARLILDCRSLQDSTKYVLAHPQMEMLCFVQRLDFRLAFTLSLRLSCLYMFAKDKISLNMKLLVLPE